MAIVVGSQPKYNSLHLIADAILIIKELFNPVDTGSFKDQQGLQVYQGSQSPIPIVLCRTIRQGLHAGYPMI